MKIKIEGQLTIGKMLEILEGTYDADKFTVRFEFGYCVPLGIACWRGVYEHAALGHDAGTYGFKHLSVTGFRRMLLGSLAQPHQGWKGGDYTFTRDTPLHVDNPGNLSHTEIVAVKFKFDANEVWLKTKIKEPY